MGILDTVGWFLSPHLWRQDEPDGHSPIKYDPQFGFKEPREERKIPMTKEEMDSCNLEPTARDFCAHIQIQWRTCIKANMPFWYKCKGLKKELNHCYWEEKIHDMKEFEREKRLNARERRLAAGAS
uniref:NADH dehydrogenase [ubiquinone] 1 beta subcomplex subunit 7 n=1 Tax=Aceria tosichella TaxID=561515 RepID=A0A6G1S7M7_9ACAR